MARRQPQPINGENAEEAEARLRNLKRRFAMGGAAILPQTTAALVADCRSAGPSGRSLPVWLCSWQ